MSLRVLLAGGPRRAFLGTCVIALIAAAGAIAYYTTAGVGTGDAGLATLNAPTDVTVPGASTGTVHVTWTAPLTGSGAVTPEGSYIERFDGSTWWPACGSSPASPVVWPAASCDDTVVATGSYSYRVTALFRTWTARSLTSGTVVVIADSTPPSSTITFPASAGAYSNGGWSNGCMNAICGTATDDLGGSGVAAVKVSIQGPGGTYWNGIDFTSLSPVWIIATGTATWSLDFPPSNFALSGAGDGAYAVEASATDSGGNPQTANASATFVLDNVAPADSLSLAAAPAPVGAYLSGSTLYYTTTVAGSFSLVDTVTDTGSGPSSAHFASAPAWGHPSETVSSGTGTAPVVSYTSTPYTWAIGSPGAGPAHVTASDAAGNTSAPGAPYVPTLDNTAPTGGSIGYADGLYATPSVAIAVTNGSDGTGSGVDASSGIVTRDTTTFADDTCGAFPGTYATTITLAGGADTTVTSGHCYRYRYRVSDNVGNESVYSSAAVARVATGPVARFDLEARTTTPTAGAGDDLTITAKNAEGNTVGSYTGTHQLTFAGAASIGTFSPSVADSSGHPVPFGSPTAITFSDGTASVAGTGNGVMTLYRAEAAAITVGDGSVSNGAGLPVAVAAGDVDAFALAAPASVTAGVPFSSTTLTAQDRYGNTAATYAGAHTIAWSGAATSPAPSYSAPSYPTSSVAFAAGVATTTLTATYYSAAGPNLLTATEGAVTGSSAPIAVAPAIAASLAFTTPPRTTAVNVSSETITVQRRDGYGNPTSSGSLPVSLTSSALSGVFRDPADALTLTQVTIADGTSTAGFLYRDAYVGDPTITAHAAGLSDATQTETVTAGPATQLAIVEQPSSTVAGATIAPAVTVAVEDALGNLVTSDDSTTVTLTIGANPGAGTLGGGGQVTVSNGVATFAGLSLDRAGVAYTLVATDTSTDGAHPYAADESDVFDIVPGPATKLAFTTSAQTITAGGAASGTITVEREDAYDNATTLGGAVTVDLSSSTGTGSFRNSADTATITGITIAAGSSSGSFRYKDSAAGLPTITAADDASALTEATQTVTVNAAGTKVAAGGGSWCSAATWSPSGVPTASDNVTISGSAATLTIPSGCAAVANSVTLGASNAHTTTLSFASSTSTLSVGGDVVITAPTGTASRDLQINAGSLTVGGNLRLSAGASGNQSTRICKVTLTSGAVTVNGNLVYNDGNFLSVNAAQNQVVISGAATFNLAGAFTIRNGGGTSTGTLVPGTASTFNFSGSAPQTIPVGVSGIAYNTLTVNNPSGATLGAAVSATNVTGNVKVQSGTLSNGGFAMAGNSGKAFEVNDNAAFVLTGTSAFPTTFTPTLTTLSTVNYAGGNQNIANAPAYGDLTVSGGGTKTALGALTVNDDLTVGTATTFAASTFTHTFKGDFTNNGTVTGTGTATFGGAGAQSIGGATSPTTFANVTINKTGTVTLAQNITVAGNLTVSSGTLDLAGLTANRTAAGGTLSVASGAALRIGGTAGFPGNFTTKTLNASSSVEYYGDTQTVGALTYGNLTISNAGSKTAAGAVVVAGTFLVSSGTYVAGASTSFAGSFTNNGTYTPGATTTFTGSAAQTIGGSGAVVFTDLTVSKAGGALTLGQSVSVDGNLAVTSGTLDLATFTADRSTPGGTISVAAAATLRIGAGTFPSNYTTTTLSTAGTVEYYGATQTIADAPTYGSLTITTAGTKTAAGPLTVAGTFLVNAGATFAASGFTHSFGGTITVNGTFAPGTSSTTLNGSGAQSIGGTTSPITFNALTVNKTGTATLTQNVSVAGDLTVSGGTLDLAAFSANRTAAGGTLTVGAADTLRIGGTGTLPANFGTVSLDPAGTVEYYGSAQTVAAQTYGNLTITNAGAKTAAAGLTLAGNLLVNAGATFAAGTFTHTFAGNLTVNGTFAPGTSTETLSGGGAQSIGGTTNPVTLGTVVVNKTGAATLTRNVSVAGDLTVSGGTLDLGAFSANRTAAGGTLTVGAADTLRIGGTGTLPSNFGTVGLDPTSTVEYYGTTQAVGARTYGNLTVTTAGVKTAAGALAVAGDLLVNTGSTLAAGTFSHTFAGNLTVNGTFTPGTSTETLNGSGAQSIGGTTNPITLGSLTVAKTGTATLAQNITATGNLAVTAGTLDLAASTASRASAGGTLSLGAADTLRIGGTGTLPANYSTVSLDPASTVEYYGSTQAVAARTYGNLTITTAGTKTAASPVSVAGDFLINAATYAAGAATTFSGNFTNNGTYTAGALATFTGALATQTIGGSTPTSFAGLTVNKAGGGVTIANTTTATGALTLTAGIVTTNADTLVAGSTVSRTSGFVNGRLQRSFAAGGSTVVFDVGSGTTYAPISVTVAGATAGTMTGSTTGSQHPNYSSSGLSASKYVNRSWTLTPGTLTVTGYNATFTFVAGDLVGSPITSALLVKRWTGSAWASPSSASSTAATVTGTTFGTAFGDYAAGN